MRSILNAMFNKLHAAIPFTKDCLVCTAAKLGSRLCLSSIAVWNTRLVKIRRNSKRPGPLQAAVRLGRLAKAANEQSICALDALHSHLALCPVSTTPWHTDHLVLHGHSWLRTVKAGKVTESSDVASTLFPWNSSLMLCWNKVLWRPCFMSPSNTTHFFRQSC